MGGYWVLGKVSAKLFSCFHFLDFEDHPPPIQSKGRGAARGAARGKPSVRGKSTAKSPAKPVNKAAKKAGDVPYVISLFPPFFSLFFCLRYVYFKLACFGL